MLLSSLRRASGPSFSRTAAICTALVVLSLLPDYGLGNPTCTGLDQYIANTNQTLAMCLRDDECTTVTCTTVPTMSLIDVSIVMLLPCTTPPSIWLQVKNGTNHVLVDRIINRSIEVFVGKESTVEIFLDIVLDNRIEGQIGLESDLVVKLINPRGQVSITPINSRTDIPLNRESCVPSSSNTTKVGATPTSPSVASNPGSDSDGNNMPQDDRNTITIIITCVVVVTVVVTVVLVISLLLIAVRKLHPKPAPASASSGGGAAPPIAHGKAKVEDRKRNGHANNGTTVGGASNGDVALQLEENTEMHSSCNGYQHGDVLSTAASAGGEKFEPDEGKSEDP